MEFLRQPNKILFVTSVFIILAAIAQLISSIEHTNLLNQQLDLVSLITIVFFAGIALLAINQRIILLCALVASVLIARIIGNLIAISFWIYFSNVDFLSVYDSATEISLRLAIMLLSAVPAYLLLRLVYLYKKANPFVRIFDRKAVYIVVVILAVTVIVLGFYFVAGLKGIFPTPT